MSHDDVDGILTAPIELPDASGGGFFGFDTSLTDENEKQNFLKQLKSEGGRPRITATLGDDDDGALGGALEDDDAGDDGGGRPAWADGGDADGDDAGFDDEETFGSIASALSTPATTPSKPLVAPNSGLSKVAKPSSSIAVTAAIDDDDDEALFGEVDRGILDDDDFDDDEIEATTTTNVAVSKNIAIKSSTPQKIYGRSRTNWR